MMYASLSSEVCDGAYWTLIVDIYIYIYMYRCVVFDYTLPIHFVIHTCSFAYGSSNTELLGVPHHYQIPNF